MRGILLFLVLIGAFGVTPAHASNVGDVSFCISNDCNAQDDTLGAGGVIPGKGKPVSNPGSGDLPDTYTYQRRTQVPACSSNRPDADDVGLCTNAISCADPLSTRYWIFEQTVTVDRNRTPQEVGGPWRRVPGEPCLTRDEADGPSIGEIVTTVRAEFVRRRPALPRLVISPAPRVLVTARNSFSAGADEPVELTDTVLGLPIVITATPRRWVWDFGDGQTLTTTTPGRPGELDVSHAYDRVGNLTVGVTVEWSGTFRVGGFTGVFPIDGVARVPSAPVVIQSREARTELVDR